MSIVGIILAFIAFAVALIVGRFFAEIIIPQSEIDEIDAIHKWAKDELDRRDAERKENGQTD